MSRSQRTSRIQTEYARFSVFIKDGEGWYRAWMNLWLQVNFIHTYQSISLWKKEADRWKFSFVPLEVLRQIVSLENTS